MIRHGEISPSLDMELKINNTLKIQIMGKKENRIEAVRSFLEAANKQFEEQGIYLNRANFRRDEQGNLDRIDLSFEDRGIVNQVQV